MSEPTATNPQTGEKIVFRNGQWQPLGAAPAAPSAPTAASPPAFIPGQISPLKQAAEQRAQQDQALQIEAAERARRDQTLQEEKLVLDRDRAALDRQKTERELARSPATEGERTAAFLATRLAASSRMLADAIAIEPDAQAPSLGVEAARSIFGDTAANYLTGGERQKVESAQLDILDAALTLGTGAAYTREQLEGYRRSYFPQLGDSEGAIADKRARLRGVLESARVKAGSAAPEIDRALASIFPEREQPEDRDTAPPALSPGVSAAGQIAGNTHDNGGGGTTVVSQGGTTTRDNPVLAGVRQEYLSRLSRGDSAESIIQWARSVGIDPSAYRSIAEQVRYRRANPNVALSEYNTSELDDEVVPLSAAEQTLNAVAQSPVGAGLIAAGDAASAFTLDNIAGATGGNAERARLGIDQVSAQNPISSMAGTLAGGTLMALGGEAALGARGMAAGLPRALAADTAYGAAAGAGATDQGNRLLGAGMGALAGAGGSYAGYRTGNALASIARGVSDSSVNALRNEGVNALTAGQIYGNSGRAGAAVRGLEDRIAGLPVVGDMVNARRSEGYRQFNSKAFDKALEPIGGTVGDAVGEDAIESAQKQVSQAFSDALSGVGINPDQAFQRDFSKALMGVRSLKRVGPEIFDDVVEIFRAYDSDPLLSGEALQTISRDLRDVKFSYKNDPRFKAVGAQIDRVERALFDMFDRQASGVVPAYNQARQAYRRLSTLEDAVMKAGNQKDKVFTPAQLGRADQSSTKRFGGKAAAARGDTPFNELQTAAQGVLPNKVPDSGTVGRALIPAAILMGGGAGVDVAGGGGIGTGLTIGTILAALYTRTGQRLLTKPGRGMKPGTTRRRVLENGRTSRAIGAAGAAGSAAALVGPE